MTAANTIDEAAIRGSQAAPMASGVRRNEILLFAVFYTLAHGGILLIPDAVYWDDWVLYRTPPEVIARMFRDAGALFDAVTYMHAGLLALGMWSYKVLTFVLWFAAGLLLDRILARTRLFPDGARLAVVLLFLVLPYNAARVAAINFPYTLTCFFFFLGWYLVDRQRIAALLLFFASFFTPSLLMFFALPVLDLAWRGGHVRSVRALIQFGLRHLDLLLLPFIFFAVRKATFNPSGTYAGYQSDYRLQYIEMALNVQWSDLQTLPLRLDGILFVLMVPLVWLLVSRIGWATFATTSPGRQRPLAWLALGLAAYVLGAFPYWVLGLWPVFAEWTSRHQLLLPLGTALMMVAALWMMSVRLRAMALSLLLAASLSFGVSTYYTFWVDWQKQLALVALFKRNPDLAKASFVVFTDRTGYLNAITRSYRFYEWNGLMVLAFGTETRFGVNSWQVTPYAHGRFDAYMKGQYKASGHRRDPEAAALLVEITEAGGTVQTDRRFGIWHWPPLPVLELRTSWQAPKPAGGK